MRKIILLGAVLISACNAQDSSAAPTTNVGSAAVGASAAAAADESAEPTDFYILLQDAGSAKMLLLDSIAGGETNTSIMVLDIFSSPQTGLLQTLEFNCPRGTYAVVRKMMIQPGEPPVESSSRGRPESVPMGSQLAFIANLACSGEAALERDKMLTSTLPDVINSYWKK